MPFIGKQGTNSNSKITKYVTTVGSGGQTNFSVSVDTGSDEVQVFLNGVLLKETTDYTLSDTQVALGSASVENDIVEIHIYRSFVLSDAFVAPSQTGHSGKYLGTDGSSTSWSSVDARHISGIKSVTLGDVAINTDSDTYQAVSQLDLSLNRTSGTHLLYWLQGGGPYSATTRSLYCKISRSDGTSYGSTNVIDLSGGVDSDTGHTRLYGGGAALLVPFSLCALDNTSVSGDKTYRTFYRSASSGDQVVFQDTDRGVVIAIVMEFIPTT